jgi:uncharacterized protein with beta-barrel porin domain
MTNSGNIVNSYIKINNLANRYDGKAFTSLFEDNALWLVAGSESEATIITPDEKIRETFNQILAISNPGNKLQAIQDILNNSTDDAQKEEIVKSVLPQVDNGVNRGTFNIATSSVNVATGRVDTLRNGKSSGDETPTKRIWGESFASSANQESTATSSGYKLNGHGFAIGGDQEIDHDQYIGGNISYANTTIKTQGSPKNTVASTYQINAYASRNFERFFLDGVAGFAWNEYTSTRTISAANTNAVGRYSGQAFISKIRTGSVFNLENSFIFTPELTITAARNKVDAYTEEGAEDLNLHVHSTSSNFLEGRVGFSLSHNDSLFGNVFIPQIRLSYGYDFIGSRQESTSNFVGQSTTFQSQGAKIVKGSTKIGGGLKLYTKGAIALSADYDLEIKAKYKAHAATARFTYAF